jgi:class 3 adenylate cyclase/pimeloyl-ACP methyl ester carboxylesterase
MTPDVRYARNGDVSLAYQVTGSAAPDLLLVSGYLSNIEFAWMYPSLAAFLARLATFSRLILMDRRGSGLSDRFIAAPPIETSVSDIEAVLDEVGSPRTTLFGIWDGCEAAILFAATHPDRVASLVLFTSSAAQRPAADYPWAWNDAEWDTWLDSIRSGWGTRSWIVKNARWMSPSMLANPDELDAWISYTRLAAGPASAEAVMRLSSRSDIRAILPTVHTPTLVLHRAGDQIEPIEAGRYVASKLPNARLVELPGDDGIPWLGDSTAVLAEVEAFVGRPVRAAQANRRLGTLLFTDIVDSTRRLSELGDERWRALLRDHDEMSRREIAREGGRFVESTGDGALAIFEGPAAAVRAAAAIARTVTSLGLEIRAGAHTGEVELDEGHVRGIAVHIAARIAALAGPSETLVSSTVKDLAAGSGIAFEDAGERELKGVADPWHVYRVVPD